MSLFGEAQGGGAGGVVANSRTLTFNAGKCAFDPSSMLVTPEKTKGSISLSKESGMLTFVWKNRETGTSDDPVMLFPGDGKFLRCKSCNEGRVYYLCFQNKRRDFFWMQHTDASKDDEYMNKINAAINGEDINSGSGASNLGDVSESDAAQLESLGISEEQLEVLNALPEEERLQMAQLLGINLPEVGRGSANATPAPFATPAQPPAAPRQAVPTQDTPAVAPDNIASNFDQNMLQNILASVSQPQDGARLTDILSPGQVSKLLDNEEFVASAMSLLPEGQQSLEGLRENISSPQYAQALQSLDGALQSGEMDASMSQFGVDPAVVAQNGGGVIGLTRALQAQANADGNKDVEMKDANS
jgi:hypothetical protein